MSYSRTCPVRLLSVLLLLAAVHNNTASSVVYTVRMVVELPYETAGFTSEAQDRFRQAIATAATATADAVTIHTFTSAAIAKRQLLVTGIDVDFSIASESEDAAERLAQSDKLSLTNLNTALEDAGLAPTTAIKTSPAVHMQNKSLAITPAPLSSASTSTDSKYVRNWSVDIGFGCLVVGLIALFLVWMGVRNLKHRKTRTAEQQAQVEGGARLNEESERVQQLVTKEQESAQIVGALVFQQGERAPDKIEEGGQDTARRAANAAARIEETRDDRSFPVLGSESELLGGVDCPAPPAAALPAR